MQNYKDCRCLNCRALLARVNDDTRGGVEIKCRKCRKLNYFILTPGEMIATIRTLDENKSTTYN
jgi:phage FluMu protein Com